MDRSLRHLGQLLVVMGALLGAVLGVALALIVENANTSEPVEAPGREGAAVLVAGPSSSRPPVSRRAGPEDSAADNGASGSRQADAADQGDGKADKNDEGRRDQPGKDKDKPDKGKG